jgi:hypothetical protein
MKKMTKKMRTTLEAMQTMHNDFDRMMKFRHSLIRVSVTLVVTFAFVWRGSADPNKSPHKPNDPAKAAKTTTPTKSTEDDSEAKPATGGTRRDPFLVPAKMIRIPKPPKPVIVKPEPKPLPAPSIEARVTEYKKQVRDFYEGRGAEPSKLAPYLIDELAVTGIFRTEEGYGAFVVESVTQKQQTFFARPGWQTFDGYIKEIAPTGVKFTRTIRLDNGTVRQTEEFRALPAANAK